MIGIQVLVCTICFCLNLMYEIETIILIETLIPILKKPDCMITGELRSRIDKVWEAFWTGGLLNPITVIEQMTYFLNTGPGSSTASSDWLQPPLRKPLPASSNNLPSTPPRSAS